MTVTLETVINDPIEPFAIINCETLEIVRCNKNFKRYFSFYSIETPGQDFYNTLALDVPEERKKEAVESLRTIGLFIDKKTSTEYYFFIQKINLEGKTYGMLGVSDQRKYAIFEQYRQLFDQNLAGVYQTDIAGNILSCNEAFVKILGYDSVDEVCGMNACEFYRFPELREKYIHRIRKEKILKNYEIEIIRKDDTIGTCLENSYLEINSSGKEIISGTVIDFTERKRMESDLKERESWFQSLGNISREGVLFERDEEIFVCNNQFASFFDFKSGEELIGRNINDFIPSIEMNKIRRGVRISPENKIEIKIFSNNKPLFLEISGSYLPYRGERTLALIVHNVTERKKAEVSQERTVLRLRNLLENLPNGVIIITDGLIKYLNGAAYTLLGAEEEDEVYNEPILDFVAKEYKVQVEKMLTEVRQGLDAEYSEIKLISLDGTGTDVGVRMVLSVYESKPSIQITLNDLSDRNLLVEEQMRIRLMEGINTALKQEIEGHKLTQEQLVKEQRESSEQKAKLEAIFNSTENLIMWTTDKSGIITNNNVNFRNWTIDFFGNRVMIGDNIISIFKKNLDPDLYQGQLDAFTKATKGKHQQTDVPIKNEKGTKMWLQLFLNPVYVDEELIEISCLAYDITERNEYEKNVRQSLKEKEVLLKEVHHRVKNNLQIISSILNLQSSYVSDEAVQDLLKESQQRIASMSLIHETIYRNSDFSAIDFAEYVGVIAGNLVQSYHKPGTQIELITELDNVTINLDQSIPCGLILNELISNAMKYAFIGRKKGKLLIQVKEKRGKQIELIIKDDGSGLPKSFDIKNSNSLGLTLVNALTEQLEGTLETKSGKGTTYILRFEKK